MRRLLVATAACAPCRLVCERVYVSVDIGARPCGRECLFHTPVLLADFPFSFGLSIRTGASDAPPPPRELRCPQAPKPGVPMAEEPGKVGRPAFVTAGKRLPPEVLRAHPVVCLAMLVRAGA